jgi:hypothetical protein
MTNPDRFAIIPLPDGPAPANAIAVGPLAMAMEYLPQSHARDKRERQAADVEMRALKTIAAANMRADSVIAREHAVAAREDAAAVAIADAVRRFHADALELLHRLDRMERARLDAAMSKLPDGDHPQGLSPVQQDNLPPAVLEPSGPEDDKQLDVVLGRERGDQSPGDLPSELEAKAPPPSGSFAIPEPIDDPRVEATSTPRLNAKAPADTPAGEAEALVKMLADSQEAFAKQSSRIRAELLAGTILASDETSARVGKRNWWTWVFHHGDACCFVIHPNRSKVVVSEFLGDYRPDFWVSDRFGAQMGWAKRDHQFCLAHLIRDAKYAIDAGDTAFAPRFRELLRRACSIAGRRPNLADSTLLCYARKLDADLDALLRIKPNHEEGKNSGPSSRSADNTCSSS